MIVALGFFVVAGCHELGHVDELGDYGTLSNEIVEGRTVSADRFDLEDFL